jgi:hypothetical protein
VHLGERPENEAQGEARGADAGRLFGVGRVNLVSSSRHHG